MTRSGLAVFVLASFGLACSVADEGYMDDIPPNGSCATDGTGTDTEGCTGTGGSDGTTTMAATSSPTTGDSGTTAGSGGGTSGGAGADACKSSDDCPGDQLCVADFDGDKRGPYRCDDICLGIMNEDMWCADAAACCSPTASCTDRGYCVEDGG